jgi:hypothetical protein
MVRRLPTMQGAGYLILVDGTEAQVGFEFDGACQAGVFTAAQGYLYGAEKFLERAVQDGEALFRMTSTITFQVSIMPVAKGRVWFEMI